ncbi:MAG: outer membrane beta-barrel protein, partial [Paracoccus sp. (in: a-proteobacteria)]|nr:outer membrane beta-barrel protein [Paracoccus sp. (in: a-proteobacteria)]
MKKLMISAAALAVSGSAALAGGYVAPVETVPVVIDTPVVVPALSWSGFYAGAQAGRFSGDLSQDGVDSSFSGNGYGLHAGYLHDMGRFVLGGELAYDRMSSLSIGDTDLENDANRLSARAIAGYDMGRVMPYATLGLARLSLDEGNGSVNSNGHLYGIGA